MVFHAAFNDNFNLIKATAQILMHVFPGFHRKLAWHMKCLVQGNSNETPNGFSEPRTRDLEVLIVSNYLSLLPDVHLSDTPRRWLVVTGDSARIQDETTQNSAWFLNVLGV